VLVQRQLGRVTASDVGRKRDHQQLLHARFGGGFGVDSF
jgi:hypothetical protein